MLGGTLLLLVGQLIHLQVVSHDYYFQVSEENRIRIVPVTPLRGKIVDREGKLLAADRLAYTVSVIPSEIKKLDRLSADLAPVLEMAQSEIARKVKECRFRRYEPVSIRRDIPFETVCIIEESAEQFPGVIYQLDHARNYLYGKLTSHLIGYTSEVDEQEAKGKYRVGALIGKAGVEREYDAQLRGIEGVNYLQVTATGRILGPLDEKPGKSPTMGMELGLTIDYDLQFVIDSLFSDTLQGAAVFIKPKTGEILALVSKPSFDANIFSGFVTTSGYGQLVNDETRPLYNRAIKGGYPPGSTAKVLTAAAALEEGIITPSSRFSPCFGGYQFGSRYFHCWKPGGHGSLDLYGAIEQSCDTYLYQLGLKLGLEKWSEYAKACGFSQLTGIDIPAERSGHIPDRNWYDKAYGKNGWTNAVMLNLAIGQGEFLSTPLELAQFYCGIVNHGSVMKPHLMMYTRDVDGSTSYFTPQEAMKLPFSESTLAVLREACRRVVQGGSGTAGRSRIPGIEMGGKTGTAQNPHGNDHSWFVGYAPAGDPEIVGCVIVEQAGHGSSVAAPFVKRVFERYFEKTGLIHPKPKPVIATKVEGSDAAD